MTAASPSADGPLLRTEPLRAYQPLGTVGNPVFNAAPQLRATIRRQIGAGVAEHLAVPRLNEAADAVSWYAPVAGPVVPWSAASEEEKRDAVKALKEARSALHARSAALLSGGDAARATDVQVFARMLPLVLHIPDEGHIYIIGGKPVVTFWGFNRLDAGPDRDVIDGMALPAAAVSAAAVPGVPTEVAAVPPPVVAGRRPWWKWLLWLLALLLLLLLLLFLLRGCGVPVPQIGLDAPEVEMPSIAAPELPAVDARDLPSMAAPDLPAAGSTSLPGMAGAPMMGGGGTGAGGMPPMEPPPEAAPAPAAPAAPAAPPAGAAPAAGPPEAAAPTDPTPPLSIPGDALQNGSTAFLDGHWRSRIGLVDSETGKPLEVEYDFRDGEGTASIVRSDGVRCTGPSKAAMAGDRLTIDHTGDAVCPDGKVFGRASVECTPGPDGAARCQGRHEGGAAYHVEMTR